MTTPMPTLPDIEARKTALTTLDQSLLVEAGAGSGKTSVMAGRVAILLARGAEPKSVAAITFTEFAASELMTRIERFVERLAAGDAPRDLESAFPNGVTHDERQKAAKARETFDQLTCTTIHGFALALIQPYPVEAGIDPGAQIMDPAEADVAFDERYDAWLRQRLSHDTADDLIPELVLADEQHGLALVRELAAFLRRNRDARPQASPWGGGLIATLSGAVADFNRELQSTPFNEEDTQAMCGAFLELSSQLSGWNLDRQEPSNRDLLAAIVAPRPEVCFTKQRTRRQLRTKGKWEKAAAARGLPKPVGAQAFLQAQTRYDACHEAFEALLSAAASEVLSRLVAALHGLSDDWQRYKRAAALLDFDDLIYTARELLRKHAQVRQALARRFRHVLVDEFQDTDPLQTEILWRLCGERQGDEDSEALSYALRPGALFTVGDPKQAIYRFRGADVNAYLDARKAIGDKAIFRITANFRSVEPILDFVNRRFENPLSEANGQPGFTPLCATCPANGAAPAVVALDVKVGDLDPRAETRRDAEAEQVAELCARLVEDLLVRDVAGGGTRPCRLGDIALLAPVGTDLWRFEEALEKRDLAVSTQAGKGFFRRQEIHDLIALTRALADGRDTLALGALLRSPLVGLTEAEFLDIADGLPVDQDHPDRLPHLNLWTEPEHIRHELAKSVLLKLQALGRRARSTTPYMLLAEAVEMLEVRSQLRQRFKTGPERVLANVDLFIEMARAYDVRGLRAFAADMHANWKDAVRQVEGRPDAEDRSVTLVTIHAAKGLEWPVVIPINMTGRPHADSGLMYDRRRGLFSTSVLEVEPVGHALLATLTEEEHRRERVRLWYVAATRARDLLVLPRHDPPADDGSWATIVDLGLTALPALDLDSIGKPPSSSSPAPENPQTREMFAQEAQRIEGARREIIWHRPSRHEGDAPATEPPPVFTDGETVEAAVVEGAPSVAGSAKRGTLLHKLMEEVLTGETPDTAAELEARAAVLLQELGIRPDSDPRQGISPNELAATVVRTLTIPEIKELRARLLPERSIHGAALDGGKEVLVAGVADALALDASGQVEVIVDWKSDVTISDTTLAIYRRQIIAYKEQTGANRALLVLMTTGRVIEVSDSSHPRR